MSKSRFFNVFANGCVGPAHSSLEDARAATTNKRGNWIGTVEAVDGDVLCWHSISVTTGGSRTAPPTTPADLTDAQIREAREVIRVARALRGGGA